MTAPELKETSMTALEQLKSWSACEEGYLWAKEAKCETMADVWDRCPRQDWMIWCVRKAGNFDRAILVNWAIACAEDVLPIFEKHYPNDKRVRECLEATKGFVAGTVTEGELRKKRNAAADAAYASYAAYAAYAAAAYAAAAYYEAAASYAASYAADAYDEAAYAAVAARAQKRQQYADLLRKMYPNPWRTK